MTIYAVFNVTSYSITRLVGCNIFIIFFGWGYGRVITYPVFFIYLQVDGTGNCLFSSIRKSMSVHTATAQEATYFPNQYFRRMVVNYMVNHWQLIYDNKFLALMSLYGVEERMDLGRGWNPPLSFKQYLRLLLQRDFWGDVLQSGPVHHVLHVVNEDHCPEHQDPAEVQDSS